MAPSPPLIENVMSWLVEMPADASIVPVIRPRRPSFASPTAPAFRVVGPGRVPEPIVVIPPLAARSSSWPYGSARTPRTSMRVARAGAMPSGTLTGMPPVASPIASRAGVPRRPASAITTPRTTTVRPTGACLAAATVIGAVDDEGDGVGVGVSVGVGTRLGELVGLAVGVSDGGGDGVGSVVGEGEGEGLGGGSSSNSPARVAWSR